MPAGRVLGGVHVYDPVLGRFEMIVLTVVRALGLPDLSVKVTSLPTTFVHLMSKGFPAVMVSPVIGAVRALDLVEDPVCAETMAAKPARATETTVLKKRILILILLFN